MAEPIKLIWKATCSKCNRARSLLQELGVEFEEREYSNRPLTEEEIREMAGSRSVLELINPQRPAYQELGFDLKPPTEEEALHAMAQDNNLVFRPIVLRGSQIVRGFDEDAIRQLAARE